MTIGPSSFPTQAGERYIVESKHFDLTGDRIVINIFRPHGSLRVFLTDDEAQTLTTAITQERAYIARSAERRTP